MANATEMAGKINLSNDNGPKAKGDSVQSVIREVFPVINTKTDTVFYIVNYDPQGFIVLAADQRSIPLLAFSSSNSFETDTDYYPLGLVHWLENTRDDIDYIRANNLAQTPEIADAWKNLDYGRYPNPFDQDPGNNEPCQTTYKIVYPLLETEWNQRCGFNDDMPLKSCANACYYNDNGYAGCVPIAVAQIMKYHEYPISYSWTNMSLNNGTSTTASFIRDIWDNIPTSKKSYNCDGTGVHADYVDNIFKTGFSYSSATYAGYNYDALEDNLDIDQPVILMGFEKEDNGWWIFHHYVTGTGHAWVSDGYMRSIPCPGIANSIVVHMNWGWWGGQSNGWYGYNDFTPGDYSFNYAKKMVYNIAP